MTHPEFRLETLYAPATGSRRDTLEFTLINLSKRRVDAPTLVYDALSGVAADASITGGKLVRRVGNKHEFALPEGSTLAPGEAWTLIADGLESPPGHRTDGPKTAHVKLADGSLIPVSVGDMIHQQGTIASKREPRHGATTALSVLPWPAEVSVEAWRIDTPLLCPARGTDIGSRLAMMRVSDLARRLHPLTGAPFAISPIGSGLPVSFSRDDDHGDEGYAIVFTHDGIGVRFGSEAGRHYALVTLAQIRMGPRTDARSHAFPVEGTIADAPRFDWRGCLLDVARRFWPVGEIERLVDIIAWQKMNVFHWHLTDDEAWRIEIPEFPELTAHDTGHAAPSIRGDPPGGQREFYSRDDVTRVVAHAAGLHVSVMPEIDIPGHCTAVLGALPELRDANEPEGSYASVHGYPNNALNPGIPATWDFIEAVFREVAELFPFDTIHVGGDEVAEGAWRESPLAQAFMAGNGIADESGLNAHLMERVRQMLRDAGKKMAGWDEIGVLFSDGSPELLVVAWQSVETTAALLRQGHRVVSSPGQAYYLDMARGPDWDKPGNGWAGSTSPETTYAFEPAAGLPDEHAARLVGVQACIWSEHLESRELFNHLVFPRLNAVAETAWTTPRVKDWERFVRVSRHMPQL